MRQFSDNSQSYSFMNFLKFANPALNRKLIYFNTLPLSTNFEAILNFFYFFYFTFFKFKIKEHGREFH